MLGNGVSLGEYEDTNWFAMQNSLSSLINRPADNLENPASKRPRWETPSVYPHIKSEEIKPLQNKSLLLWSSFTNRVAEPGDVPWPSEDKREARIDYPGLATARLKLGTNLLQQLVPPVPKPLMFSRAPETRECAVYALARTALHQTCALAQNQGRSMVDSQKSLTSGAPMVQNNPFNVSYSTLNAKSGGTSTKVSLGNMAPSPSTFTSNEIETASDMSLSKHQSRVVKRRDKLLDKLKSVEQRISETIDSPPVDLHQLIQEHNLLDQTSSLMKLRSIHGPSFLAMDKRDRCVKPLPSSDSQPQKQGFEHPKNTASLPIKISSLFKSDVMYL